MLHSFRQTPPSTRRRLLEDLARTTMGVSLLPSLSSHAAGAAPAADAARHVIYLYMQGAMSHIDTFDPKPGRDAGGGQQAG